MKSFSLSVCWGWETYRLGVRCAVRNTTQSSPWLISSQIMALKTADWGRKCEPPGHSDAEVLAGQWSWFCLGVDVVCPEWQGFAKLGFKTKLTAEGLDSLHFEGLTIMKTCSLWWNDIQGSLSVWRPKGIRLQAFFHQQYPMLAPILCLLMFPSFCYGGFKFFYKFWESESELFALYWNMAAVQKHHQQQSSDSKHKSSNFTKFSRFETPIIKLNVIKFPWGIRGWSRVSSQIHRQLQEHLSEGSPTRPAYESWHLENTQGPMESMIFWMVATQMIFIFTPTWGRFRFWLIVFNWVETTN